jgi:TPR repeat protein
MGLGATLSAPAKSDYQTGVEAYSRGDFKAAMAEWLPLAEAGNPTAQNSVGALYDHGLGVDEDDATAAYWYQLAADQNFPLAMRNLANKYASGHGVPYDKALADSWFEKAASLGDPVAIRRQASLSPSSEFTSAAEPVTAAGGAAAVEAAPPPVEAAPALAQPMTVAGDDSIAESDPVPEAPTLPEPAPAAEAPATAPANGGEPLQYGDTSAPAAAAAAAPATTQQAALTPAAPDGGNWLIGMWQGPSLGCPPGGGLEFAPGETRSYYGGQVAARLEAKYEVSGERITVTTIGVDGVGQSYEYERRGPDTFVITAVPADMPSSMVGVEHRRCAGGPLAAAAPAPTPAPAPEDAAPAPIAKPFIPAEPTPETQPAPKAAPVAPVADAPQPAPVADWQQTAATPRNATAQDGWDAFGRGDYHGALAVWKPLAENGDVSMQLLVASIYDYGQGVPQDDAEAVKWYERAASQGSAKGQYQAGAVYARSPQIKDPVQGYKWLTIAARTLKDGPQSGITADQALTLRTLIEGEMSEADIAKAKQEADAFKAK